MSLRMYRSLRSNLKKLMRPFDPAALVGDMHFYFVFTRVEAWNKHTIQKRL
jgi:hypothetical protein